jgi:tetratricopeptide (TPR) repeat protein
MNTIFRIRNAINRELNYTKTDKNFLNEPFYLLLLIISFLWILGSYSNHFENGFYFDDSHTIESNNAIKEINIKAIFSDPAYFSTSKSNQTYRPLTVLENALDYKLGNGLNSTIFHVHIFTTFILLWLLLLFFTKTLLDRVAPSSYNQYLALLVANVFCLLCANAETVNYIIQRAEIVSGLFVVAGLLAYINSSFLRKSYLYLLFPLVGFLSKEMAFVFAPLLLMYLIIVEEEVYLLKLFKRENLKKCIKSLIKTLPAFLLTIGYYLFMRSITVNFDPAGLNSQYNYLITQPMVISHYIFSYFVPYNLSVDSDWTIYTTIFDYRAIIGILIIAIIFYFALKASKNKNTRLISFGLLWFFISISLTSSFFPLAEVLNDHRPFIPYIGLTIAFIAGVQYLLKVKFSEYLPTNRFQILILGIGILFLGANSYGIRERNKVWKTSLSLWKDASIKSPKNGRALMNYGNALMAKGNYDEALKMFNKSVALNPSYYLPYINIAIAKNQLGDKPNAEENFKKALRIKQDKTSHYYYGRFLLSENRLEEALSHLKISYQLSPNFSTIESLLFDTYHRLENWEEAQNILDKSQDRNFSNQYSDIIKNKKTALEVQLERVNRTRKKQEYLSLSLKYINNNKFKEAIVVAKKAIELDSNYISAYNNYGYAHFKLGNYNKAIFIYKKALKRDPNYSLIKNNLKNALLFKKEKESSYREPLKRFTYVDYINFSLANYNEGNYQLSIVNSKKSIKIWPNSIAYNNMCAAYNQLKKHDEAISACTKALELDENNILAKNNLELAKKNKQNDRKN